jgi:hypothetical protein
MAKQPSGYGSKPSWPTIEEQLAASKVARGSPLEKLILENQDFTMLRPEEAHDDLGLPPWIRVFWRRLHPEQDYSSQDATGGYPLSLRDTYHAMLLDQEWPARFADQLRAISSASDKSRRTPRERGGRHEQ